MADNFLHGDRGQPFRLPPDLRDWLTAGHLAWFVLDVVDQLDLTAFYQAAHRNDGHGQVDTIILQGSFDFPGTTMPELANRTVAAAQQLYGGAAAAPRHQGLRRPRNPLNPPLAPVSNASSHHERRGRTGRKGYLCNSLLHVSDVRVGWPSPHSR